MITNAYHFLCPNYLKYNYVYSLIYAFAKRKKTDEEEHQEETEPDHVSSEEYTWMPSLFSWYGDDAPE